MFDKALAELASGRKARHWMWFVFPQARSLGRSTTALFYGIRSLAEARAFLSHPILGDRLCLATQTASAAGSSLNALFGSPDDLKFRSSMTLLAAVAPDAALFAAALERWGLGPDKADPGSGADGPGRPDRL